MRPGELIAGSRGARPGTPADLEHAWQILRAVMDPEVPVVSVVDLGIVRDLDWQEGHLHVVVTPTYSGCPATEVIEQDIQHALETAGFSAPRLERRLTPPWTTDWITIAGRQALSAYGIAPPVLGSSKRSLLGEAAEINCPQCGSRHTERLSEFGSTACKALYRCLDCREPFDYFKCI
ncbi:1,2-phenylacetyl-CoA epoxidase subunit PaaD [Pseudomonas oryzihabitans]|uniref:Phenylacetate-CoA oxygenase subunit PaaJ n=1 Tax=Pseudomonas oryzihabitans TaxID=47885 RepID=A0ABX3IRW6_9PSED|nr:1,2-phenylacetyl-CoA epoxidase subunit PaaD [Pseudomonas psychrotolerans]ONN71063.1 phenylacetate-CoA oxygenase subunit PaaJ [Pseudomonas psychrotolerans]